MQAARSLNDAHYRFQCGAIRACSVRAVLRRFTPLLRQVNQEPVGRVYNAAPVFSGLLRHQQRHSAAPSSDTADFYFTAFIVQCALVRGMGVSQSSCRVLPPRAHHLLFRSQVPAQTQLQILWERRCCRWRLLGKRARQLHQRSARPVSGLTMAPLRQHRRGVRASCPSSTRLSTNARLAAVHACSSPSQHSIHFSSSEHVTPCAAPRQLAESPLSSRAWIFRPGMMRSL